MLGDYTERSPEAGGIGHDWGVDWKGPLVSTIFAAGVLCGGFWVEPMWALGDVRWGIAVAVCVAAIVVIYATGPLRRRLRPQARPAVTTEANNVRLAVDYTQACAIANRYIDPDQTMAAGAKITVRAQILAKFDKVVGARIGDEYNGRLLHQWLQKNAASILVAHQGEIT